MKLQNLAIIFILIIIPIALVLGMYIRGQGDTITLQNKYDSFLRNSNYDAVSAYKINTHDNELVNNADSIREDIKAATNTFMMSMASSLNMSQNDVKVYVPAMLYTLYDGYYIYSAVKDDSGNIDYTLKPYVYYSERIKDEDSKIDIVINYTLDNYIAIYGKVEDTYVAKSGYLIDPGKYKNESGKLTYTVKGKEYEIKKEELKENIKVRYKENDLDEDYSYALLENVKYKYIDQKKLYYIDGENASNAHIADAGWYTYSSTRGELVKSTYTVIDDLDDSAIKYYEDAASFTNWLLEDKYYDSEGNEKNGLDLIHNDINNKLNFLTSIKNSDDNNNDPENYNSKFCEHKREIIKKSIETNLKNAIDNFSAMSQALGTTINYKMPILLEEDWDKVYSEVTMTTFFQGLPIGFKTYNSYSIIPVTGNTQYVNPALLYFIDNDNNEFHKITCENLNTTTGYRSIDFEEYKIQLTDMQVVDATGKTEEVLGQRADYQYYFKHAQSGCYQCIVQDETEAGVYKNGYFSDKLIESENATAYFTTLARERYNQYKATGYLNNNFNIGDDDDIDAIDPSKPGFIINFKNNANYIYSVTENKGDEKDNLDYINDFEKRNDESIKRNIGTNDDGSGKNEYYQYIIEPDSNESNDYFYDLTLKEIGLNIDYTYDETLDFSDRFTINYNIDYNGRKWQR